MAKTKKRKKILDDDEDWVPGGKKKKEPNKKTGRHAGESCFIHCTHSNEALTKLPSLESWEKLLEAARLRGDEKVLQLESSASTSENNDYPVIYYHNSCRKNYTHRKALNVILAKVSSFSF